MDQAVLRDARRRLHNDDRRLDELMADLHSKQRQLAEDAEQARKARADAEQASRDVEALRMRLEEHEREEKKGVRKKLTEQFQRARAEVQATVDALKRDQKLMKAQETKQRLVELEQESRSSLAPVQEPVPVLRLGIGSAVEIAGLGISGTLLESPQGKKRVRVKVGEGEVLATVANLTGVPTSYEGLSKPSPASIGRNPAQGISFREDEQSQVDVRGQAADEALDHVLAALDRATVSGAPFLRIIHGHGTGRLKSALRAYLKDSPYVAEFRPGERAEGGDGVTIATLRI